MTIALFAFAIAAGYPAGRLVCRALRAAGVQL